MNITPLNIVLFGIAALFGVGFYGLLITRNLIKIDGLADSDQRCGVGVGLRGKVER